MPASVSSSPKNSISRLTWLTRGAAYATLPCTSAGVVHMVLREAIALIGRAGWPASLLPTQQHTPVDGWGCSPSPRATAGSGRAPPEIHPLGCQTLQGMDQKQRVRLSSVEDSTECDCRHCQRCTPPHPPRLQSLGCAAPAPPGRRSLPRHTPSPVAQTCAEVQVQDNVVKAHVELEKTVPSILSALTFHRSL